MQCVWPIFVGPQFNAGLECEFLTASDGSLLWLGMIVPRQEITGNSGACVKLSTETVH